jgi:hypothetical protein
MKTLLHQEGVKVKRSKVFSEENLNGLVTHLTLRVGDSEGIDKSVAAMDWAAVFYLREMLARDKKCGKIRQVRSTPHKGLFIQDG